MTFEDDLAERFSLVLRHQTPAGTKRRRAWEDRQKRGVLLAQPSIEIPREHLAELIARGQAPAAAMDDPKVRNRYVAAAVRHALGIE